MFLLQLISAVKCNPDPTVIKILAALNAGFDCASEVNYCDFLLRSYSIHHTKLFIILFKKNFVINSS